MTQSSSTEQQEEEEEVWIEANPHRKHLQTKTVPSHPDTIKHELAITVTKLQPAISGCAITVPDKIVKRPPLVAGPSMPPNYGVKCTVGAEKRSPLIAGPSMPPNYGDKCTVGAEKGSPLIAGPSMPPNYGDKCTVRAEKRSPLIAGPSMPPKYGDKCTVGAKKGSPLIAGPSMPPNYGVECTVGAEKRSPLIAGPSMPPNYGVECTVGAEKRSPLIAGPSMPPNYGVECTVGAEKRSPLIAGPSMPPKYGVECTVGAEKRSPLIAGPSMPPNYGVKCTVGAEKRSPLIAGPSKPNPGFCQPPSLKRDSWMLLCEDADQICIGKGVNKNAMKKAKRSADNDAQLMNVLNARELNPSIKHQRQSHTFQCDNSSTVNSRTANSRTANRNILTPDLVANEYRLSVNEILNRSSSSAAAISHIDWDRKLFNRSEQKCKFCTVMMMPDAKIIGFGKKKSTLTHYVCSLDCDIESWMDVKDLVAKYVTEFSPDHECVITEIVRNSSPTSHFRIDCFALANSNKESAMATAYFKKALMDSEEWSAQNKKIIELNDFDCVRRKIPADFPYFAVWFSSTGSGFAHVIERRSEYGYDFAKSIIATMLGLEQHQFRDSKSDVDRLRQVFIS